MRLFHLALFLPLFFGACQNEKNNSAPTTGTTPATEVKPEYPFPIYTGFDQFKPWLHRDSDTTYVINFWATWCKPCVAELPYFEELTQKYRDEKVRVVLVSLDFPNQLKEKLIPFVQSHDLQSQVVALFDGDYNSWIDQIDPSWDGAIPVTVIYNRSKRKFFGRAFHDLEDLENALKKIR
ncbi:MAG: TlpA family protein disulfide reductase [Bacteroidetes bacterium]|nr:MAG: TlpA family protein disulfide reductase [Bacteroidota bacterium]